METEKIVNLLNDFDNESSKLATKKRYVIHDQNGVEYGELNKNGTNIISSRYDYSDANVLVTRDITATNGDVAFKKRAPFTKCITHTNDVHIDTAENIDNAYVQFD